MYPNTCTSSSVDSSYTDFASQRHLTKEMVCLSIPSSKMLDDVVYMEHKMKWQHCRRLFPVSWGDKSLIKRLQPQKHVVFTALDIRPPRATDKVGYKKLREVLS
ncbi:hypothetical protein CEXT_242151 [Caerostris extrusa]|uniref:Uncharacterized protein n=1 Tax=Caerostris extrusa TaxID=172846 RepID=A0AAV4S1C6_CAEEX|nr:hypothetical protein CEXT_242151 [Caerostris extrusa]